jgi:hypothetical protein
MGAALPVLHALGPGSERLAGTMPELANTEVYLAADQSSHAGD